MAPSRSSSSYARPRKETQRYACGKFKSPKLWRRIVDKFGSHRKCIVCNADKRARSASALQSSMPSRVVPLLPANTTPSLQQNLAAFQTVFTAKEEQKVKRLTAATERFGSNEQFHGMVDLRLSQCLYALDKPVTRPDGTRLPFDTRVVANEILSVAKMVGSFSPAKHKASGAVYKATTKSLAREVAGVSSPDQLFVSVNGGQGVALSPKAAELLRATKTDLVSHPALRNARATQKALLAA